MSYVANLTGAGWVVGEITPKQPPYAYSGGYTRNLTGGGWVVDPIPPKAGALVKTDKQGYGAGTYGAYNSMWYTLNDATFNEGDEFDCSNTINPATFPAGSTIAWRVPASAPTLSGVYGYLFQHYGNYQDGSTPTGITPAQIYTLTSLTTTFNYTYTSAADSGVLEEFWATSIARNNGDSFDPYRLVEIGRFRRTSSQTISYMNGATPIGTFSDGVRTLTVAVDNAIGPPFVMFRPSDNSSVQGAWDWIPLLNYLMAQGVITGSEWFNGMAIGVEPRQGSGTCAISAMSASHAATARVPFTQTGVTATAQSAATVLLGYSAAPGATSYQYRVNGGTAVSMPGDKIVTGLTASTAYTFEVRGVNGTGNGAWSNVANATTLAAGPTNLIANGTFDGNNDAGWNNLWYDGKSVTGDKLSFVGTSQYENTSYSLGSLTVGKYYELTYTLVWTAGEILPRLNGGTNVAYTARSASGTFTQRVQAVSGNNALEFLLSGTAPNSMTLDNISVIGPYDTP